MIVSLQNRPADRCPAAFRCRVPFLLEFIVTEDTISLLRVLRRSIP